MQESYRNGVVLMNVSKLTQNVNIKPTDRKMKKAKVAAKKFGVLPKEMPIEKTVYIKTLSEMFERVKDSIQISVDNMTR